MIYYVVTSSFGLRRQSASIVRVFEADSKPESVCFSTKDEDVFTDYFSDRLEAEAYVKRVRSHNHCKEGKAWK